MKKLMIHDPINNNFEEVESIQEFKEYIDERFTSPGDGIHPDVESVELHLLHATVDVEKLKNGFYKINVEKVADEEKQSLEQSNRELVEALKKALPYIDKKFYGQGESCENPDYVIIKNLLSKQPSSTPQQKKGGQDG